MLDMFEMIKKMAEKELKQQPELAKKLKLLMSLYDLEHNREGKTEDERIEIAREALKELDMPLDILIIGSTGVGKSSTINAIYGDNKTKIGSGAKPQTQEIQECKISRNITLYDSPGLGEGSEKDRQHMQKIHKLLTKKDRNGNAKVDLALVIIDATVKGLGQEYETIKYLLKTIGDTSRILIGLNKCDSVVSERYFDRQNNKLSPQQEDFLKEKVEDLRFRIKEDTDLELGSDDIVYYSAGFYDEYEKKQDKPYNIELLAAMIMSKIPKQKRLVQEVEEKDEVRKERERSRKESSFFDNIINFADAITDAIPVVRTIKKVVKTGFEAVKSVLDWFF